MKRVRQLLRGRKTAKTNRQRSRSFFISKGWVERLESRLLLSGGSLTTNNIEVPRSSTTVLVLGTLHSGNNTVALTEGTNAHTTISWGDPNHAVSEGTLVPTATFGDYTVEGTDNGTSGPYTVDGTYSATVTVSWTEDNGQTATLSGSLTATVADNEATLTPLALRVGEGQPFTGQIGTIVDPTATGNDSFTATINWGDGTTGTGAVTPFGSAGTFAVAGSHAYATSGAYTLIIAATETGVAPPATATANETVDVLETDLSVTAVPVTGGDGTQLNVPVATFTDPGAVQSFSTVPGNGDTNPYGVAIVPAGFPTGGRLQPGDTLVSNFNNSVGTQGTGTTIQLITPSGQVSTFYTSSAQGLDTGLVVLKSGYVIVANVPNAGAGALGHGSLQVLDANGTLLETLSVLPVIDPWDLTVNDQGGTAQLFVSNVSGTSGPNGSVWRIDLTTPPGGNVGVTGVVKIGSGYNTRLDTNAFVVGPGGMAYDASTDTLYVASQAEKVNGTEVGTIFSIANAGATTSDNGEGTVVYADPAHLHGPMGLVLAPNGNLITANSDAVNADPNQPSELVELTTGGQFVGQYSVDAANGGAFGLAIGTVAGEYRFAAVDDNVPNISLYDFQPTSPTVTTYSSVINWGDNSSSAGTITYSNGSFTVSGSHTYADEGTYTVTPIVGEGGLSQQAVVTNSMMFQALLNGIQQVPPVVTQATGTATLLLSPDQTKLTYDSSFAGLIGNALHIHLHNGAPLTNGPVATDANGAPIELASLPAAPTGVAAEQTFTVTPSFVSQLLAGNIYENIHTTQPPFDVLGLIRGQFAPANFATGTATITEADATITGLPVQFGAGVPFSGQIATLNDPNSPDPASDFSVSISWGDGTTGTATLSGNAGSYTITGAHTYATPGHYAISLSASESGVLPVVVATATSTADVAETGLTTKALPVTIGENQSFTGPVATFTDPQAVLSVSTAAINGDTNPRALAIVPANVAPGGELQPGDSLTANFNDHHNVQSLGSTVTRITAGGQTSTFSGFFQGIDGVVALSSGIVVTAIESVGTFGGSGFLSFFNSDGTFVSPYQYFLPANQQPWAIIAANDQGSHAQLFVSTFSQTAGPNGKIDRIDLTVNNNGSVTVNGIVQIASGYSTRLDPNQVAVGPAGMAYDAATDTLYVASEAEKVNGNEVGTIFAIPNASTTTTDNGEGAMVYDDPAHLHGPFGLVLAPNGDLITANSDAVNADPTQPSELVELTTSGQFVGQFSIDSHLGAASALAITTVGGQYRLEAVNDRLGMLNFYNFQPTLPTVGTYNATIDWGDSTTTAGTVTFNNGTFTVSGSHTYAEDGSYPVAVAVVENGVSQIFATTLSGSQQVPPTNSLGTGAGGIFLTADQATITVSSSFSGLTGTATAAHLHNAAAGQNGPVATDAAGNKIEFTRVPSATSGTIPAQSFNVNAAFVQQLLEGKIYENVHTTAFAEGEIRGQFTPTNFSTSSATVTENDAAMTGTAIQSVVNSAFSGQLGTLTDPGSEPGSDYTATINWGDGTTGDGTVTGAAGSYTISGSHTYTTPGHFTISLAAGEIGVMPAVIATATSTADVAETGITTTALPLKLGERQAFNGPVATFTDPNAVQTYPTVPSNGDVNPYGLAIVPQSFPNSGVLQPGDTLAANFNNAANTQGTGTTITRITAAGVTSTFFSSAAQGLDTGLVVLKSGFVIVANVPNAGNGTLNQGSLQVLDSNGNLVETISNPALLADPWDLTVNDQGSTVQLFASNVSGTTGANGTVTRVDLTVPAAGIPQVQNMVQIASGYATRLDANAFVVGPGGLAYDAATDTLYVASQAEKVGGVEVGTIYSVANAGTTIVDHGKGSVVYADATHLHGPMGLVLAPNGDVITANSDAVNADANQPSELVEFTTAGQFVGQFSVDPNNGGAFNLAIGTIGGQYRLAAVDDNTAAVSLYDFQPTNPVVSTYSATINWGDGTTTAGVVSYQNGTFTVSGTHTYADDGSYTIDVTAEENGVSQFFTTTLSGAQQVPPTNSAATGTGSIFLTANQSTITINSAFNGLSGPPAAAHLHNAAAGQNGPVATDAAGNRIEFTGVPAATSGTIPAQTFNVNAPFVNQLLAGNIYENIHTAAFPAGEIRGQLTPTNFSSSTATVAEDDATITGSTLQLGANTAFSGQVATLNDPGSADPSSSYTVAINWGDGTTGTATVSGSNGAYPISGSHTYLAPGHYIISLSASEAGVTPSVIATDTITADIAATGVVTTTLPINANEHQAISGTIATFTDPAAVQTFSTVPSNGDVNPYGVAIVPPSFPTDGVLQPGDTLIANFNNSGNTQGTGTTITRITAAGQESTFFTSTSIGLDTGLVVLKSGFVVVANVPNAGNGRLGQGSLQVLDKNGNLVETITNAAFLDDPWDLTVNDQGSTVQLFVSNVSGTTGPNGTVTRVDLTVPAGGIPQVQSMTTIASGYSTRLDANAFVVGPGGLAYDATSGTLYVASQAERVNGLEVGTIYAIANAGTTLGSNGKGTVVYADPTHLHGPIGMVLAPNGDLIVANSDAVNADPNQPSELVEITTSGQFVGQFSVDPANGGAFGLAIGSIGGQYRLAAVDDNTSTISLFDFQPTNPVVATYSATISWGDGTSSAGTITYSNGTFTVSGSHTYADDGTYSVGVSASQNGVSQLIATTLSGAQQVPPTNSTGTGTGTIFLSADQKTITVNSSFSGLLSLPTAAHLHNAPAGTNGPVATDANGNNIAFTGVPSAASGAIPTQSFSVNSAFVNQLLAGNIYENIHTGAFPEGEIRGQFMPSSFAAATATIAEVDASITGQTILAGEALNFAGVVATINDPGSNDAASAYSATINWGDGTTSIGTITGSAGVYSIAGSHTYALAGHYTISLAAFENGITPSPIATGTSLANVAETDLAVHAQPIQVPQNHQFSGTVATFTDPGAVLTFSTVPTNGDVNPYGVAVVPAGFPIGGTLQPGDTLVANFNNSANNQGTGTSITRITASGRQSTFFTGTAKGLDTGLVVLKSGFVVVANVPNAGNGTLAQGSLQVLDASGNVVETITDANLLADPWDITANDQGSTLQLFVSNVSGTSGPNGSVTRIDLTVPAGGIPQVQSMLRIASGYNTRLDANAFVVGPAGLAYDAGSDTLYVASQAEKVNGTEAGTIFSIAHAGITAVDSGEGSVVYADATHLHGPVGLVLAPNGDLITANSDAVNADPNQPSELVEFTTAGQFVGQFSVDPNNGGAFGLAMGTVGGEYRLAAVDDNTSKISFYDFQPTSPTVTNYSATINWGDGSSTAGTIVFANGAFTVNGTHTYAAFGNYPMSVAVTENGVAQLLETTLSGAQQVQPTVSKGTGTGSIFLSEDESTITINSSFSGLSGLATAAHLHNAPAGANGPVATDANGNNIEFSGVPSATSGTVPTQSFAVNAGFVNQLLAGNIYENIHTTVFQEGEIRGQFTPTNYSATTAQVAEDVITLIALPVQVAELHAFSGTVATFTDISGAPASDFAATIDWGDHLTTSGSVSLVGGIYTVNASHTYADDGKFPLTVSVTESAGKLPGPSATATAAATVTESDATLIAQDISIGEGQSFSGQIAVLSDPGSTDAATDYTVTVNWGDGTSGPATLAGANGSYTVTGKHTYAEDDTYTLSLAASETGVLPSPVATATGTANVAEDDITVTASAISTGENQPFNGTVASFTDPGATAADAYTAIVHWGDGSSSTATVTGSGGSYTVADGHTYAEDGSYTVTITVTENGVTQQGSAASATAVATVTENDITVTAKPVQGVENIAFSGAVATFTDPTTAAADTFTAEIDWGDGVANVGTLALENGVFTVSGTHTYGDDGQYTVGVSVQEKGVDQLGGSGTASAVATITNASPRASWADNAFEDLLGREIDPGSLTGFVAAQQAGVSRSALSLFITNGDEYLTDEIDRAYAEFLGRVADPLGQAFWLSQMRSGLSYEQLQAAFIASPEYYLDAGGTDRGFVDKLYFDLLGRQPDALGENYWVQALAAGESRFDVALGFTTSNERESIVIGQDYVNLLHRQGTPQEIANWVEAYDAGQSNEDIAAAFVASDEYFHVVGQD